MDLENGENENIMARLKLPEAMVQENRKAIGKLVNSQNKGKSVRGERGLFNEGVEDDVFEETLALDKYSAPVNSTPANRTNSTLSLANVKEDEKQSIEIVGKDKVTPRQDRTKKKISVFQHEGGE